MSSTLLCNVPVQTGIHQECQVTINAGGIVLLLEGMPLGAVIPDEYDVVFEGVEMSVQFDGENHCIVEDDKTAFTALVYG